MLETHSDDVTTRFPQWLRPRPRVLVGGGKGAVLRSSGSCEKTELTSICPTVGTTPTVPTPSALTERRRGWRGFEGGGCG